MVGQRITLERFRDRIGELAGDLHGAAMRGLRAGAKAGVDVVREEIDATSPHPPIATGGMRDSVTYAPTATGVQLYVDSPHAIYMEAGTRPHFPPIAPLVEWVKVKGLASTEAEARSIAYAVAIKISEEGISPRRFFRRAMRRIIGDVIPREIKRELRNLRRRKARRGA